MSRWRGVARCRGRGGAVWGRGRGGAGGGRESVEATYQDSVRQLSGCGFPRLKTARGAYPRRHVRFCPGRGGRRETGRVGPPLPGARGPRGRRRPRRVRRPPRGPAQAPGPADPRRDDAGGRRPGGHTAAAGRGRAGGTRPAADPDADGAFHRGRPPRGSRPGRRRLPHEAVQPPRADGPRTDTAAARGRHPRAAARRGPGGPAGGRPGGRPGAARGDGRRAASRLHAGRVRPPHGARRGAGPGLHPAAAPRPGPRLVGLHIGADGGRARAQPAQEDRDGAAAAEAVGDGIRGGVQADGWGWGGGGCGWEWGWSGVGWGWR